MNRRYQLAAVCLLICSLAGCFAGGSAIGKSQQHRQRANYYQAYRTLLDEGVDDAEVLGDARIAYLLEHGQELVFADRELEAIQVFDEVLELRPGHEIGLTWKLKARAKLADRATELADTMREDGDLEGALRAYRDAMLYADDHPPALAGIQEVANVVARREARAEDHYLRGVMALGEQLYGQTWYHMVNALAMKPDFPKAKARRDSAQQKLAEVRYESAKDAEKGGHYGAALKEYQALMLDVPELDGLEQRIAHMRREVEAEALVRESEMAVFRGAYDKARGLLEKAYEISIAEQAAISELLILVKERDLEDRYQQARIHMLEYRLEEAVAAFKAIDEAWPGFKDVKAQISGLEASIDAAVKSTAAGQDAEAKGDLKGAIQAYEDALLMYPGYAGLDAKVKELRAKLGADG